MKIGITITETAYTPEAYAYKDYLEKKGCAVQLDFAQCLDPYNDVNIYFMGTRPFWHKQKQRAKEIHEYHSLSTGKYPKLKNEIKKLVNKKPDGRIFLNAFVAEQLSFKDTIPFIFREMGVDECFFQTPSQTPDFDIVYCGSILGRAGLVETLVSLSSRFKVVVIGEVPAEIKSIFSAAKITMTGRLNRVEIASVYQNARFGLNYTPDVYPFNIQTSTKTLEYFASGLSVISNRYPWIENFVKQHNAEIIWLDHCFSQEMPSLNRQVDMSQYKWENILDSCNFVDYLQRI